MGKTVLIVDDSLFVRNLMRDILQDAGIKNIVDAIDGKDSIEKYDLAKPDLVFMDIMMPGMNGIDAMKEIILRHKDAKIIIITSIQQSAVIKDALNSGALDFISKPVKREEVQSQIKKYFG